VRFEQQPESYESDTLTTRPLTQYLGVGLFELVLMECVVVDDRLLNDLVLWEPMAPKPIDTQETNSFMPGSAWSPQLVAQLMHQGPVSENFSACKSGIQYGASVFYDVLL